MRREIITLEELHPSQEQVLSESSRFNVLNCGRRWGKTTLSKNLLSETALNGDPAGYFTPTYKLLEGTFKETLIDLEPVTRRKHDNQFIELVTGGIIEFWSLDNPFAGRSRKYKRAIIDEAAFVKSLTTSWNESIRPTLTDLIGDAWFMSTPRGKNDFYKFHQRGKSNEKNWASWTLPTNTNPFIDKQELEDARIDLPEIAYNQEYLAIFSDNVANPFGIKYIERCIKTLSNNPAVVYGIDLAKSVDWTVVIGLDEYRQICFFDRWQSDWGQTKQRIKNIVGSTEALVDATGVGDPIVEDIQKECHAIEGFKFTSESKQQIMEGLAASVQKSEITILDGILRDEMESFEFEYSRTGKVKYRAPDGMHDDCVCALALANHKFSHKNFLGYIHTKVY